MKVPLTAGLVTISACRSAGGRAYAGEGLVGFAWAFLRAGAAGSAGLWDVNDRSTAALMAGLYSGLAAGTSISDALRASKMELIRTGGAYAKPFYWAPFQLYTRRIPPAGIDFGGTGKQPRSRQSAPSRPFAAPGK